MTRIVVNVDVVVNYVDGPIRGDMLLSYRGVSAERDKMCHIHPESQDPREGIRKTIPDPRERLGRASGMPNPSMPAQWLSQGD